jgi:hypothetical protein
VVWHFAQRFRSTPESDFVLAQLAHFGEMGLGLRLAMMYVMKFRMLKLERQGIV